MVQDPPSSLLPLPAPGVEALPDERGVLSGYQVATSELLEARALLRRVDTKFIIPRAEVPALLDSLRPDFHVVHSAGQPVAHYRTLYQDTDELRFYHEHRRGIRPRTKVRIRHYLERELALLEIKQRDNHEITSKVRLPHTPGDFLLTAEQRAELRERLSLESELQARCWVEVPRVTLVGTVELERITIDLGMRLRDDENERNFNGMAIVELKQSRYRSSSEAYRALRALGQPAEGMSKYCVATALFSRVTEVAHFLPVIRTLERYS